MRSYTMGIDNGGTYVKAALYDIDGEMLALAKEASPAYNDGFGRSERDQDELWQTNCRCIRRLLEKSGADPSQVAAIAVSGQGKGLYSLGRDGRSPRRAITSADLRAADIVERWHEMGITQELYRSICQDIHPYQPAALLAWLKENEPGVYARIRWVMPMKDYINYRLTGNVASDYCSQSGSPFINFSSMDYDGAIFNALGIEEAFAMLPPLKLPWETCGLVTEQAAEQTGLVAGIPVTVGMFDVNASALAMGVVDPDTLFLITGTWSINAYCAPSPVTDRSVAFNSIYFLPGRFMAEEGSPTSAGILEWAINALYGDASLRAPNESLYDAINAAVAKIDPASSGVIFLPFVHGGIDSDDSIGGAWMDMTASTKREHLLTAVYEGTAFAHKIHIERLKTSHPAPFNIRLAGGVINSPVWLQMFADILAAPIEIVDGKELGTRGAALNAGIAAGFYNNYREAVEKCVRVKRIIYPNPARTAVYDDKYRLFLDAAERLDKSKRPYDVV